MMRTWTGRKSLAAAIRFWLSTVIHSTWRCHSGGALRTVGGGARRDPVKEEYVTKSERKTESKAGRRSASPESKW